jgi:hypothetical protein
MLLFTLILNTFKYNITDIGNMDKKTFNPLDWIDFEATAKQVSESEDYRQVGDAGSAAGGVTDDVASDVESIIKIIEERKVDITAKYADWRNIGFGLAGASGEGGRDNFHRVSCFYHFYTKAECDGQYSSSLADGAWWVSELYGV